MEAPCSRQLVRTPVPLIIVELRLIGGALSRNPAQPPAVSGRDGAFKQRRGVRRGARTACPEQIRRRREGLSLEWERGRSLRFAHSWTQRPLAKSESS